MSEKTRSKSDSGSNEPVLATLADWFAGHARDLPWRRRRNGYFALVSEAMLQQTQVSRVIERFTAFTNRFPSIEDLAAASEQEVLAHWQGLGYYLRARNLHAAARLIVRDHDGKVPHSVEQLLRLPGIGRYTAGAIASIVFGEHVPIVEGNVERVLTRWFAHRECNAARLRKWAWATAEQIIAVSDDPGTTNEALMELGAMICTPRSPACADCPAAAWCAANRSSLQHEIPAAKPAPVQKEVHHHAVIVRRGRRILLEQRPESGLWSLMWQTPTIESTRPLKPAEVRRRLSAKVEQLLRCDRFQHATTHRRITFHVFTATSPARAGTWRAPSNVDDLPLSSPQQRIVRLACEIRGG